MCIWNEFLKEFKVYYHYMKIIEEIFLSFREKHNLKTIPVTIWLNPLLSLKEVYWINPEQE